MCQPRVNQYHPHMAGYNSGCCGCGCGPLLRRFLTTEEQLERLKNYREQLAKDLAAIQERISEFKEG